MGVKISFDATGTPQEPTLILAYPNGDKIGQLNVHGILIKDSLNTATEISCSMQKYLDGKTNILWDHMTNFKRIWWKEQNAWFEATTEIDESENTVKTIYCVDLPHAELSQIMLYDIEINTETDISREDYTLPTILYDPSQPQASLLHRITEKAPNYNIIHVDDTIAKIQRIFTFDNISLYDAFQEIASEINCLFVFKASSDTNGKILRTISVYDLEQNCLDCGYRGEFTDICPKCGSHQINNGYGQDTTICVSIDDLAQDIQFTTDTAAVKNCFKLEGGDDLMTATIRNCNANGTDYIWYFSSDMKKDMSYALRTKLDGYDELYTSYQNDYQINVDSDLLAQYNSLVEKYNEFNPDLEEIVSPITGYVSLMQAYYNTIDMEVYLRSSLMPDAQMSDTNATQQAGLLTANNLSPVAVSNISTISLATANNAVLSMAKVIIDSRYRVKIDTSSLEVAQWDLKWTGNFIVENYSDETDIATSNTITIVINDDYESFLKQKIEKALHKENTDEMSVVGLFERDYDDFCVELKKYALNRLISFLNACQSCIDILVEQGVGTETTWSGQDPNLYDDLYIPYYNKLQAIESEIGVRQAEINLITGVYNEDGELITAGIQSQLVDERNYIQDTLNFENYLGNELWSEFSAFRREDLYRNDNYISDSLNNSELFQMAQIFLQTANNELYKSAELQHSITASLKNLFAVNKLKPWGDYFEVGNWMRIKTNDSIYKLRLLEYQINFDDFSMLSSVQFSDLLKVSNGLNDVRSVLAQASTMATSYESVKKQANKSEKNNNIINGWFENGLDATNTKIVNGAEGQTQTWDSHGLLFRQYDSITESYSPTQIKIINDVIALTTDNWLTTKTAIGHFYYNDPSTGERKDAYGVNGETIVGRLLIGQQLGIYNSSGTLTFDDNGFQVSNDNNAVIINPNSASLFTIRNKEGNVFSFDQNGNLVIVGEIIAQSLTLLGETSIDGDRIDGLSTVALTGSYTDLINQPNLNIYVAKDSVVGNTPSNGVTGFKLSSQGLLEVGNAIIYCSSGVIGGLDVGNGYLRFRDSSNLYSGIGTSGFPYIFFAGSSSTNGSDAISRVESSGHLYSSDVDLTGKMSANQMFIKDKINFWPDGYDIDSYGTLIEIIPESTVSGNSVYNLILGKTSNSNLSDNSSQFPSLKFGYVRVPSEIIIGEYDTGIRLSQTIQELLERVSALENNT